MMARKTHFNSLDEHAFHPEKQWQNFLDGELASLGNIFRYFYNDLYYYGLAYCQQKELVKDSIQELFVTINQSREKLSRAHSVKAYLISCFRRLLLKKLKRQRNKKIEYDERKSVSNEAFQFSPEEIIIEKEVIEERQIELKKALQMLPVRQKEILFLRYFHGMSYQEIEEIVSIDYQSIRNHIYRATKRLRNILEKDDIMGGMPLLKASSL